MDTLRDTIKNRLRTRSAIDPAEEITARVDFLAQYLSASGARGFALGISGGQDSTLAGRLAQLAVEKLRKEGYPAEFWAIRLPYGVQADEEDARIALAFIRPDHSVTINIKPATDACAADVAQALGLETLNDFNKGNVKVRQRMIAQYALAGEKGLLVIGTDHAAENVTGFFTKFGDGAADILPLAGLSKRQGAQLLQALNAPDSTWLKVPTADLEEERPALPDEVALGVTYSDIDTYIEGSGEVSEKAAARIEHLWKIGEHKRHLPVEPGDTWWRR
ncbi:ammonia-dependent NAD(+) synthetase [Corynebacterium pseudotuberculosis]|uniref:NH(3)-dependent NAD(+) synthetase n=1 Tax=Corynebacterium pseudotuberculosis (strain C231) TaxID=681645 RepID=D9QC65_CORP2|nr:ammonia-dependent NAD(+) synthetase [Corynebacterium pseudotuberculosis]ADL11141.1 ammonia-dependent NAD(+) synthetase [Corynebacterium pseudotuberculosis C231]ADO26944.1 ammonia-dependent NAD(+) synthetase [Corynebacterium pseudotuberculosis I19]AEK93004.1 NH(3)-dependent NAD(+) synthetase [Corynebacterium pseudotuberculosis PAT10]AEP70912.1 NH(3)-dependent NAD(+) synthetase [Corynebacterium pseudotuberculosis 42/02-A]AFF22830.1 NH(3)-dependent NAD(+) synthetase [Corynebacterium pseudotube